MSAVPDARCDDLQWPDRQDEFDHRADASPWPPPGLLDVTVPGPVLAGMLNTAFLPELPDDVVVEVVAGAARLASWAASVEQAATAEVTRRAAGWRGVGDRADQVPAEVMAAAEVGPALTLSPAAARNRVELARSLGRLQATRLALAGGRIDLTRARAMVDAVAGLSDEIAAAVEAQVIDRASTQTAAALKACLRRAVIRADPDAAEARRKTKVRERGVWREALDDGMARLEWTGPVEQVETTYTWLTAAARSVQAGDRAAGGPVRTLDQCRSDVLADLGDHALAGQDLPRQQGRRPQIGVLVGASTLLGLDDEPGELAGVGPVHASVARRIAGGGTWRRLLTDPVTGALSHMSTDNYEPSQEIRDAVVTRDQTCTGLGCRLRAELCDLDHRVPYPEGPTAATNLDPACRGWHRVKTLTDTIVTSDGTGGLLITLPSGRRYHRPATPLLDRGPRTADGDAVMSQLADHPDTDPDPPPALLDPPPF